MRERLKEAGRLTRVLGDEARSFLRAGADYGAQLLDDRGDAGAVARMPGLWELLAQADEFERVSPEGGGVSAGRVGPLRVRAGFEGRPGF